MLPGVVPATAEAVCSVVAGLVSFLVLRRAAQAVCEAASPTATVAPPAEA